MRTHGHTYFVNLTIAGDKLDHNGFLINFSDLKTNPRPIRSLLIK